MILTSVNRILLGALFVAHGAIIAIFNFSAEEFSAPAHTRSSAHSTKHTTNMHSRPQLYARWYHRVDIELYL